MHFEVQGVVARRRRRSYTKQDKAELAVQCLQPHVSIASIALANGLNANLLHRWVEEYKRSRADAETNGALRVSTLLDRAPAFVELRAHCMPLKLDIAQRRQRRSVMTQQNLLNLCGYVMTQ